MVERIPCCARTSNGLVLTMLMVPHYWYWLIENQNGFTNESRNAMVLTYDLISSFFFIFRSNSQDCAPLFPSFLFERRKKRRKWCSWLDPAYSWNKQLAHTPFPKNINTPSTTLRFIGFVAKISVLTPKLPADGQ